MKIYFGVAMWSLLAISVLAQTVAVPLAAVNVTTTPTLVAPANDARYALSCTVTGGSVRWGNDRLLTDSSSGQLIQVNSAIEILSRGPVYMVATSTTATVSCTEELR
jgi:hypothetical protein